MAKKTKAELEEENKQLRAQLGNSQIADIQSSKPAPKPNTVEKLASVESLGSWDNPEMYSCRNCGHSIMSSSAGEHKLSHGDHPDATVNYLVRQEIIVIDGQRIAVSRTHPLEWGMPLDDGRVRGRVYALQEKANAMKRL